jgi:hypothetical protein
MAAGHHGPPRQIRPCPRICTPMLASNNSNPTALLACRHEIYYDIHLQAGQCGLPAENMHAQLGLCITGYGATSMSHARYTTHIKTTSAQLHGAGWNPIRCRCAPHFCCRQAIAVCLQRTYMPSWAFAIEYDATSRSHLRYTTHIDTTSAQLHGAGWSPHHLRCTVYFRFPEP